jgi:signal transduction histidine kinase/CheY-like chemotaxis protein
MFNLDIKNKLRWLVAFPIVTFAALGLFSLANTWWIFAGTEIVYGTTEDFLLTAQEITKPLNEVRQLSLSIVMAPDPKVREQFKKQEEAITRQLDQTFSQWKLDRTRAREETTFRDLRASWSRYKTLKDFTIEKALNNYREEAFINAIDSERQQFDDVGSCLQLWREAKTENARAIYDGARWQYHAIWWFVGLVISLATLIVAGAGLAITRSIVRPLSVLTESASRIAREETTLEDQTRDLAFVASRDDETGQLARTLRKMLEALRSARDELEERVRDRTIKLALANQGLEDEIAERKRAEYESHRAREIAEEASRAKGEFLANVSHEIRTPINAILGMTELTLDTDLTTEQHENLAIVQSATNSLLTIINDLLEFSKIEAGKLELDPIPFDLRNSLDDVMGMLALRAHTKGLELTCRVGPDVPHQVIGDSARLRQILINLVGNAIKFTEGGDVGVDVEVEAPGEAEVELHFRVRDTGIGVPKAKQKVIFEPFTQADGSTTRLYGGTGLGLTISAQLVGLMGGQVWVDSAVGEGSTFHFTARLGVSGDVPWAERASLERLQGLNVLVVDDNSINRRILAEALNLWGMLPTLAEDGRAALAHLQQARHTGKSFSLVIIDAHMPEMDGFALAERIGTNPGLTVAMLLMLTSADRPGAAERGRELGIAAYLTKPIRRRQLLEVIKTTLGMKALEDCRRSSVASAKTTATTRPLRILVAEDNPFNQRVAVLMLAKLGHAATVAGNGKEAVESLERLDFDLVFMDVQMPEMDGFQATTAIRSMEVGTSRHVPIIAMTAHAGNEDRDRCLDGGMNGYVSKPIQEDTLRQAIEESLLGPTLSLHSNNRTSR